MIAAGANCKMSGFRGCLASDVIRRKASLALFRACSRAKMQLFFAKNVAINKIMLNFAKISNPNTTEGHFTTNTKNDINIIFKGY